MADTALVERQLRDRFLVEGVRSIQWVASNVFSADFTDHPSIMFELSGVLVPMTHKEPLPATIQRIIERIMKQGAATSTTIALRLDGFTRTPLESYGDIVFGDALGSSLQLELLRLGVGRVGRPTPDILALLAAEAKAPVRSWSWCVAQAERGVAWNRIVHGVVVDVVAADWVRCRIIDDDSGASLRRPIVLVNVHGVAGYHIGTQVGYNGMRAAQQFLFHTVVRLTVHHNVPADKDVSNNTQEADWCQLEHVKATVEVVRLAADAVPSGRSTFWDVVAPIEFEDAAKPLRPSVDDVESVCASVHGDWGRTLLRLKYAKMIALDHFNKHRARNYSSMLRDVVIGGGLSLSGAVVAITDQPSSGTTSPTTPNAPTRAHRAALLELWHTWVAHADPLATLPPLTHHWLPVRCALPPHELIHQPPLAASIHGVDVIHVEGATSHPLSFLRLSLMVSLSGSFIVAKRQLHRNTAHGTISLYPAPSPITFPPTTPSVDECYGPRLHIRGIYDPGVSDVDVTRCELQSCITHYLPTAYDPTAHHPKYDGTASSASRDVRLDLQLPKGVPTLIFVVDLRLQYHGKPVSSTRSVYCLHEGGTMLPPHNNFTSTGSSEGAESALDADEMVCVAVTDKDDDPRDTTSNAPNDAVVDGWRTTTAYHGLVDVYLRVREGVMLSHGLLLAITHTVMYRGVDVVFTQRCVINGRGGFYAHVSTSPNTSMPNEDSLLRILDPYVLMPPSTSLVTEPTDPAIDTPSPPSNPPVIDDIDEHGSIVMLVEADTTDVALMYPSVMTLDVPLLSFALSPVQLFASHPKHHRNIISEQDKSDAKGYSHVDAAFMRLRFPRLPNLFRSNTDRLPLLLRNCLNCSTLQLPKDLNFIGEERPFASLLAALMMLLPRSSPKMDSRGFDEPIVKNLQAHVALFRSSGVLFTRSHTAGEESASPTRSIASRLLVFGTRQKFTESLMNPASDLMLPRHVQQRVGIDFIHAIATEVALQSHGAVEGASGNLSWLPDDAADRPMAHGGLGHAAMNTPHTLYRPRDGVGVIGYPLMRKVEGTTADTTRDTLVALQPIPLGLGGKATSNMYRLSSYGQVSRDTIFHHQLLQQRNGRGVIDYMTLLLRQRRGEFPGGMLKVYTNVHEPMYFLYVARETMRYQISLTWECFRSDDTAVNDEEERTLYNRLVVIAEAILRDASMAVGGMASYLRIETNIASEGSTDMCTVLIYPIELGDLEDDSLDDDRDFRMRGNVLGRLPAAQVRVWWVGGPTLLTHEVVKLR